MRGATLLNRKAGLKPGRKKRMDEVETTIILKEEER